MSSPMDDDAQKLHQERMQKLNLVMGHLGYRNNTNNNTTNSSNDGNVDASSLLSVKDVAALRRKMLHLDEQPDPSASASTSTSPASWRLVHTQPDDSYIFAIVRWIGRSVKSSIEAGLYHTQQVHLQYQEQQRQQALVAAEKRKAEELEAQRIKAERIKLAAEEKAKKLAEQEKLRTKDDLPPSAEGRTIKLSLSEGEAANLHPKVSMIRTEILDMEKKLHDDLDRVLKTRLRFLTLSREEPPCLREMKGVADCYVQFAEKKFKTAQLLEKEAATPDIVKRHQKDTTAAASSSSSSLSKSANFSSRKHPDLPEELLASEEVMKLSTSVLACREMAKRLEKCSVNAGLNHVEKNHGDEV